MKIFEENYILRFCTTKTVSETNKNFPIFRKTSKGPIIPRNSDMPSREDKQQKRPKEYKENPTKNRAKYFPHAHLYRSKSIWKRTRESKFEYCYSTLKSQAFRQRSDFQSFWKRCRACIEKVYKRFLHHTTTQRKSCRHVGYEDDVWFVSIRWAWDLSLSFESKKAATHKKVLTNSERKAQSLATSSSKTSFPRWRRECCTVHQKNAQTKSVRRTTRSQRTPTRMNHI